MKDRSNRRDFLGSAARMALVTPAALTLPFSVRDSDALGFWLSEQGIGSLRDSRTDDVIARDESYWAKVRKLYTLQRDVINLDNGWTNPAPEASLVELSQNARKLEGLPAEHLPAMWEEITTKKVRAALAVAMGVPGDELAIVRNATEALNTVLLGYKLRAGDEVVCSRHDYYAMLDALEQRRARDGIVLRIVEPPIPAASVNALLALYQQAIGPKTRLVLLTHPSNLTGQLVPAREIADVAHRHGAEVVVDGAQSLGLLPNPVASLGCDYYGASAHKWLGTPVGLGVLWMRKANVDKVWPLLPPKPDEQGVSRFEWIGTTPEYINVAAIPALTLHNELGAGRKRARLRYLAGVTRTSLTSAHPEIMFYANASDGMTLGLTTFEIPGVDSSQLQKELRSKDGILVQAMTGIRSDPRIKGIRVSPNVYTPVQHIARFVDASASITKRLRK